VQIGNAYYNCSCVRYVTPDDSVWLIAGTSAAAFVVIIIVIVIVMVVVCRKRHSKDGDVNNACDDNWAGSMEMDEDDMNYCTIPAAEAESNANEYCSTGPVQPPDNKEYSALEPTAPAGSASPYYLSLQNNPEVAAADEAWLQSLYCILCD